MRTSKTLASVLFATILTVPTVSHSTECSTSKCYIDAYKSIASSELPVLARVNEIYRKLTRTIGSQQASRSKLLVIDSDGYPWAVALSDNSVVLTKGAIERMYRENDLELGDARMAFVLGHELSHLATEDLFHHRAFVSNKRLRKNLWSQPRPEEELRADIGNGSDFFRQWLVQFGDADSNNGSHPDNETRRQFLLRGFETILQDVPYYRFAVALAHFGHYEDAQQLLQDYLNRVQTVEAYSNLGYVHLQRARQKMPVEMAYKYWIPTLLEPSSGLELTRERSLFEQELPQQAMDHLLKAEQRLKHAINMDEQQLTSYINLAAVYLYMPDKIHRAYAAIEDARQTRTGKIPSVRHQLESIYQLIRVQDDADNGDRWSNARDKMEELASKHPVPDNLLFNFARMLDNRGRDDTATQYWQQLHDRLATLPPTYQTQVCFRLQRDNNCTTRENINPPWITDEILNNSDMQSVLQNIQERDIRYPEVKNYLKQYWNIKSPPPKTLPGLQAQVFINDEGNSLLALDNHIEMMIVRNVPPEFRDLTALQKNFGTPQVSLPVPGGQLLSFDSGWSALVQNRKVVEIWIAELAHRG